MIAYRALRALARLALRWFYRDVAVVDGDRLPDRGPALLASNHPNALVDALVIGGMMRRPVTLTAKATLLDHPITRGILGLAGVVPLRRASDEASRSTAGAPIDPARNAHAFGAVLDVLQRGGAVLLFPEGKSHSGPMLAPLKTGLARIALMARDERGMTAIPIIPLGLTFECKWQPRSRIVMHVGAPITVDPEIPNASDGVAALTERIDAGLRAVTLNFGSSHEAERVLAVSTLLAEMLDDFRPLHEPDPPLADSVRLAKRVGTITTQLSGIEPELRGRVERFAERLAAFDRTARGHRIAVNDAQMSTGIRAGSWFVLRELVIATLAGPLAIWGRVNHWLPLRLTRRLALRASRTPDEPATNTIVAGVGVVLAFYAAQTSLVAWAAGWLTAVVYAVSLPVSATWDIEYADRLRRAVSRVRTYLRLRRDLTLRDHLLEELGWLRAETLELNEALREAPPDAIGV